MKKVICIGLPILVLFASVRIASINIDVSKQIAKEETHPFGAVVPFEKNYFFNESETIDGYTIEVKEANIITMDDFLALCEETPQYLIDVQFSDWFDHVYLVIVTFTNESNDWYGVQGVDLFHYKLVGPDYYLQVFEELHGIANPRLQGGERFTLEKGNSIDVVLPFSINTQSETATSIDYVERTKPKLLISQYPTKIYLEIG